MAELTYGWVSKSRGRNPVSVRSDSRQHFPPVNETRKHHYVPVFYQTHFTNANGLLWVYDRYRETWKELHPSSICAQNDLYAFKTEKGTVDRRIETKILSKIDGLSAGALRRFANGEWKSPSPELLGEIIFLAALQHTRVPANRDFITMLYEGAVNDFMEVAFWNIERAKASMSNYETDTGNKLDVSPEEMVESVKSGSIKAVATAVPFIDSIAALTTEIAKVFQQFEGC